MDGWDGGWMDGWMDGGMDEMEERAHSLQYARDHKQISEDFSVAMNVIDTNKPQN